MLSQCLSAIILCIVGLVGVPQPVQAQGEQCALGPYLRPVIVTTGFRGSLLFNSSNEFSVEWLDPADLVPGNGTEAQDDLRLPLKWNPANLTQEQTPVGPEAFPGDEMPGLLFPNGTLSPLLQASLTHIVSIVQVWENSTEAQGMQLLYTVAYDWRRDLWEQADRMAEMVDFVLEETGCKPIIVAHSFGGLVTYNAIARFGKATADKIQGVLYGGTPVQPAASALSVFILGQPESGDLVDPELLFTYASLYALIPPPQDTCTNGPPLLAASGPATSPAGAPADAPAADVTECAPGDLRTGITCKSEACGRPADWPEGEPFYLGVDLHNPGTWQALGLGLPAARVIAGETELQSILYSPEELQHIGFAAAAGERVCNATIGIDAADVAAIHPPAVQLSLHLTNVSIPGQPEPVDFSVPNSLECVPAPTFGQPNESQCELILPDELGPGDGLLTTASTLFLEPDLFGDKLQVANVTVPSPFWLAAAQTLPDLPFSPHQAILQARTTPLDSFVDCSEFTATLEVVPGEFPSLEAMLCALVLQGAPPAADAPAGAADPPADAADGPEAAPADRGVVDDTDAALHATPTGTMPLAAAAVAAVAWGVHHM
eukprot:jgi/Ulvmu1/3628/UM017_0040.1